MPCPSSITAVISFCSNDWRFLRRCVSEARACGKIIITVCDHFFDGSEENYALLEEVFRTFPDCQFLLFHFDPVESYRAFSPYYPDHPDWRHEWHNTGRWLSYFYSNTDFLLFLDCDEIIEKEALLDWLQMADFEDHSCYRFACLWHFREAKYEALEFDAMSMLVKKSALDPNFLWDEDERMGIFQRLPQKKASNVVGKNGKPMVRHYTGVRTKEELLKKFAVWGHHWERDWKHLVHEEFSRPFNGKDFIRRFRYREIEPLFDPLQESVPPMHPLSYEEFLRGLHRFANVITVSKREAFKRQLYDEVRNHH
jgi:hypothetical protein